MAKPKIIIEESVGAFFPGSADRLPAASVVVYDEDKFLGGGMVGAVYEAELAETWQKLVAKIKHATSSATESEFRREYGLLRDMQGVVQSDALPPIATGHIDGDAAKPAALVSPFYSHRLEDHLRMLQQQHNWLQAETLAVKAAIAFAGVMVRLRQKTAYTCADRKPADFFLTDGDSPSPEHIVIIDWNAVREQTPEFFASELRLLASIWHNLLLGRVMLRDTLQPFKDEAWQRSMMTAAGGAVSLGLRLIMTAAAGPEAKRFVNDAGEPDYQKALPVLEAWYQVLTQADTSRLEAAVQHFYREVSPFVALPSETLKMAIQEDYAWRRSGSPKDRQNERDALLKSLYEASLQVGGDYQEIVALAAQQNITGALSLVGSRLEQADGQHREHLGRWQVLLHSIEPITTSANTRVLESVIELLVEAGRALMAVPSGDTEESLAAVQDLLEQAKKLDAAADPLRSVEAELALRKEAIGYRGLTFSKKQEKFRKLQGDAAQITYFNLKNAGQTGGDPRESQLDDILLYSQLLTGINDLLAEKALYHPETGLNRATTDDFRQGYELALSLSEAGERSILQRELLPFIHYVDWVEKYASPLAFARTEDAALPGELRLAFQAGAALRETPLGKQIEGTILTILSQVIQTALNRLEDILQSTATRRQAVAARELWKALTHHEGLLSDILQHASGGGQLSNRMQDAHKNYKKLTTFYDDWAQTAGEVTLSQWLAGSGSTAVSPEKVNALIGLMEQVEHLKREGIKVNMTELVGNTEEFTKRIAEALEGFTQKTAEALQVRQTVRELNNYITQTLATGLSEVRTDVGSLKNQVSLVEEKLHEMPQPAATQSFHQDETDVSERINRLIKQDGEFNNTLNLVEQRLEELTTKVGETQQMLGGEVATRLQENQRKIIDRRLKKAEKLIRLCTAPQQCYDLYQKLLELPSEYSADAFPETTQFQWRNALKSAVEKLRDLAKQKAHQVWHKWAKQHLDEQTVLDDIAAALEDLQPPTETGD